MPGLYLTAPHFANAKQQVVGRASADVAQPPTTRAPTIALPDVMTTADIDLDDVLLAHTEWTRGVHYNFAYPPSEARIGPDATLFDRVAYASATNPANPGPITIRLEHVEWPIIIAASNTRTSIVTVRDVIIGVYREARYQAIRFAGRHYLQQTNQYLHQAVGAAQHGTGSQQQRENEVISVISDHFGQRTHWAGLYRGLNKENVWVLETL